MLSFIVLCIAPAGTARSLLGSMRNSEAILHLSQKRLPCHQLRKSCTKQTTWNTNL